MAVQPPSLELSKICLYKVYSVHAVFYVDLTRHYLNNHLPIYQLWESQCITYYLQPYQGRTTGEYFQNSEQRLEHIHSYHQKTRPNHPGNIITLILKSILIYSQKCELRSKLMDIVNLECLILISKVGTYKFEDQYLIPKLKLSLRSV